MPNASSSTELLLSQALAGSRECLGRLLDDYRNYMKLLVSGQLDKKLRPRVSASDVVQETFLEAMRDFSQFRGASSREFSAWLRRILANNLQGVIERHILAEKRDVRRDVSLEAMARGMEESSMRLAEVLPAVGRSPSGMLLQREQELVLADRLSQLPPDYRDVLVMRHFEGLSFEAAAARMERTSGAVRMLWLRAIQTLRANYEASDDQ